MFTSGTRGAILPVIFLLSAKVESKRRNENQELYIFVTGQKLCILEPNAISVLFPFPSLCPVWTENWTRATE